MDNLSLKHPFSQTGQPANTVKIDGFRNVVPITKFKNIESLFQVIWKNIFTEAKYGYCLSFNDSISRETNPHSVDLSQLPKPSILLQPVCRECTKWNCHVQLRFPPQTHPCRLQFSETWIRELELLDRYKAKILRKPSRSHSEEPWETLWSYISEMGVRLCTSPNSSCLTEMSINSPSPFCLWDISTANNRQKRKGVKMRLNMQVTVFLFPS